MGGGGSKSSSGTSGGYSWNGGSGGSFNPESFNKQMGSDLQRAYQSGPAPVYGKSLYTGMSDYTRRELDNVFSTAKRNAGMFDGGIDYTQGLLSGNGLAGGQKGNINTVNNIAGQYGGIAGQLRGQSTAERGLLDLAGQFSGQSAAERGYTDMYRSAGDPSLTEQTLLSRARGDEVTNNPYLDDIISQTNDSAYADVMASLGSSGRTGSNVHMETLGGTLADNESRLRYGDYDNAMRRQTEALGMIEGQRQQGFTNQFNALGAADSARFNQAGTRAGLLSNSDSARLNQINTRMGALNAQAGTAGNAFGMEQQGVANAMGATAALPGLYDASMQPARDRLGVKQAYDQNRQAQRMADYELFERQNGGVFNHLAQYQGLLGGAAQTAEQTKETPWWQQALGAASIGSGIFGNVAGGWSDMGW